MPSLAAPCGYCVLRRVPATQGKLASMSEVHQELQALRARNFSNIFTTSFLD